MNISIRLHVSLGVRETLVFYVFLESFWSNIGTHYKSFVYFFSSRKEEPVVLVAHIC